MERTAFVLDTNVLLHDPNAVHAFDGDVVIPMAVIEEIDKIKKERSDRGRAARAVSRILAGYQDDGSLAKGVPLPNGHKLFVQFDLEADGGDRGQSPDERIINVAVMYGMSPGSKRSRKKVRAVLVSNDLNVRIRADACGVEVQGYDGKNEADSSEICSGVVQLGVMPEIIDAFYRDGGVQLEFEDGEAPAPNEFLVMNDGSRSAIAQWHAGTAVKLNHDGACVYSSISAKNKEQKFALELLLDPAVEVVTLVGVAGTGKTLVAIAAGLHQVEAGLYEKVVVTRPVVEMGNGIGYLPGDMKEKLGPLMQPIADNIEFLVNGSKKKSKQRKDGQQVQRTAMDDLEMFGQLEVAALPYIRGRTMPRQFIIVDEAQNLTQHEVKTIISRAGEGSKIVLTGDPDQIDNKTVDALTNGLSVVVAAFRGEDNAGHITLTKGERSRLAEQAAKLL